MENKEDIYNAFKDELTEIVKQIFDHDKSIRPCFFIAVTEKGMNDLVATYPAFKNSIQKYEGDSYESFLKHYEGPIEDAKKEYKKYNKKAVHVLHIDMYHFFFNEMIKKDKEIAQRFKIAARELMQETIDKVMAVTVTEFVGFSFILECNYQQFNLGGKEKKMNKAQLEEAVGNHLKEFNQMKEERTVKEGVFVYFETTQKHDIIVYNILRNDDTGYAELFQEDFGKNALPLDADDANSNAQFGGLFSDFIPKLKFTKTQMN